MLSCFIIGVKNSSLKIKHSDFIGGKMDTTETELRTKLINVEVSRNSVCDVMVGKLIYGNISLNINYVNFKDSPKDEFRPSMIYNQDNQTIWKFKDENFKGIAKLVLYEELKEHVIVLENWGKIIKVIPVVDLLSRKPIAVLDGKIIFVGGRKRKELIDIKERIARQLGMTPIFSKEEQFFIHAQRSLEIEKAREATELKKKEEQERHLAEEKAKLEKIRTIMAQPKIEAVSPEGQKLYGIQVKEGEWQILDSGTRVILVEKDELGVIKLLEAFFVKKGKNGRPEKGLPKIALPRVEKQREPVAKAIGLLYFEIEGQLEEVSLFTQNGLDNLQKSGLNGGTMIAVGEQDGKQFRLVKLEEGNCCEVGYFVPKVEKYFTSIW
jgi:hypothetical protein